VINGEALHDVAQASRLRGGTKREYGAAKDGAPIETH
jgi:hypothetical protein